MNKPSHKANRVMAPFLQGAIFPVALVTATLVFAQCTQIDAFKKIADYKSWYEDYQNQIDQLKGLADAEKADIFAELTGIDIAGKIDEMEAKQGEFFGTVYRDVGETPAASALTKVGGLSKEKPSLENGTTGINQAASECWRSHYGANISFETDEPVRVGPDSGACSGVEETLDALAVQPTGDKGQIEPNVSLETEVSRSIFYGEYPVLDVIRSDLAWLRDHPEAWHPMRLSPSKTEFTLEEASQQSRKQQRLAAILAGRGLEAVNYRRFDSDDDTISGREDAQLAMQTLGELSYLYSSFAHYPTSLYQLMPARQSLRDITADDIDQAEEGDRKAMLEQLEQMQTNVALVKEQSKMRYERLLGLWLADSQGDQVSQLMEMRQ